MSDLCSAAGKRIRALREKKNLTRAKLSEITGVSAKFLYELENGKKGFSAEILSRICKGLNANSDYILKGSTKSISETELSQILNHFSSSQLNELHSVIYLINTLAKKNNNSPSN